MIHRFALCLLLCGTVTVVRTQAADETQPKSNVTEAIKARLAQEAKPGATKPAGAAKAQAAAAQPEQAPTPASPASGTPADKPSPENAKAQEQAPTVLDPVEVRRRKITEFEQQVQKQEADIIREKKNTKATELDKALNDSTLARALALFGGKSNEQRAAVASERVSMMEDEKDIIEAINHAKTKEEKKELQKQLDEMRKVRRELEKSLK